MSKLPAVYIITNATKTVTYIGVTSDLVKRIAQHREGYFEGFSQKYHCKQLVYFERYDDMEHAIQREKQLKKFRREKKVALIKEMNPEWNDLWEEIIR